MGELSANVFAGDNPIAFNPKSTIPLFIVQLLIIICFCRIIGYFLGKLRQPQVISEILGGVLLGPSVMGQIPGFHDNIFPDESLYYLQLVANLGLLMFLFIVGLELDLSVVKRNIHKSAVISISAIALTFGLSSAVAYAVYNLMDVTTTDFGTFVLFMGVAMSITAFPVLARILTELNMLHTTVGVVTIGASAVDDVISWCLLALVLAVLSSSGGLVILWVLLCTAGFVLTMLLVIRPLLYKFFVWTNSFED
ncbi:K(+)/H(+) antiporter, partial [Dimargaris verticillata]